jgi:H+-translocating NAD(P) transhydrogenase subunit beta
MMLASDRFMASAISLVKMLPDAPTSAPATIRAQFPMTNPAIATAVPVNAFSSEITTGMSAPPIGRTIITPNARAASTRMSMAGKLQGFVPSQPIIFKGSRLLNVALAVVAIGAAAFLFTTASLPVLLILVLAALAFGVMMVLPIGGADMPVVISLLNAFTGTAVAMAGFVIDNWALIIAGALVGASGSILTKLMADAMNRSLANIIIGGFGTGDTAAAIGGPVDAHVRSIAADDAAIQLAYAQKVIIVPGYGLAAAQAQHGVAELAKVLEDHGVEVS